MRAILLAGGLSLIFTLLGTVLAIRILVAREYGQLIRDDGPTTHHTKRGTPTMGGTVIILASVSAYFIATFATGRSPSVSAMLLLLLFGGLTLLAERRLDLIGGLLAGLATMARIDAPADLLLLVPYAVLVAPLAGAGLGVGVGCGLLAGAVLSRPYLGALAGELLMIAAATALLGGLSLLVRRSWRSGRWPAWLPARLPARLPTVAAGAACG